jgi:hypothetical protein
MFYFQITYLIKRLKYYRELLNLKYFKTNFQLVSLRSRQEDKDV